MSLHWCIFARLPEDVEMEAAVWGGDEGGVEVVGGGDGGGGSK